MTKSFPPPDSQAGNAPLWRRSIWVMAKGYAPDEGGMQTYARQVAESYRALGGQVTVFTQSRAGPRETTLDGVAVIDVGPGGGIGLAVRLARAISAARKSGGAPDFLHATTWRTAILPMLFGLSYVVTVHGREIMRVRGLSLRIMRRVLRGAVRIIAVSEHTRAKLLARLPECESRSMVAWNGLSPGMAPAASNDDGPPLILTLCRLEPRKNVAMAIAAAAQCARRGYDFRYVICGRGPMLAALRSEIATQGMSDYVSLRGFVSDEEARTLYAKADIFLHPQIAGDDGRDFEGFGIAVADAMAARTACIVGREGGTRELIQDGSTGYVVDGRDGNAVASALSTLLAAPTTRAEMAARAAEWARAHFDWRRHCRTALGIAEPVPAAIA